MLHLKRHWIITNIAIILQKEQYLFVDDVCFDILSNANIFRRV